eukprot:2091905-Prymnesium_polylepis.1
MLNVSSVVVMGTGGSMLYCGPRTFADGRCALTAHFDGGGLSLRAISHNPAEAIMEAMADECYGARLEEIARHEADVAEL